MVLGLVGSGQHMSPTLKRRCPHVRMFLSIRRSYRQQSKRHQLATCWFWCHRFHRNRLKKSREEQDHAMRVLLSVHKAAPAKHLWGLSVSLTHCLPTGSRWYKTCNLWFDLRWRRRWTVQLKKQKHLQQPFVQQWLRNLMKFVQGSRWRGPCYE